MSDSTPAEPQHPVLSATRARQGRLGRRMVWVLVLGALLAGAGLFLAWTWKAPSLAAATPGNAQVSSGAAFNAPEPAAVTRGPGADRAAPQTPAKP